MAEIVPFRGVLYDPAKVGDISRVVSPPYDVIGPTEQADFYNRHSCNIVRLELGRDEPGDTVGANRYTRAKAYLEEWLRKGDLRRDNRPGIYLYAIQYRPPSGEELTMCGFLSLVTLEEFGTGRIFPHENTRAAAKSDRYQLLETCRSNFSPIFSLYSDPEGRIMRVLEKSVDEDKPRIDVTDDDGVRHRVWTVHNEAVLAEAVALMAPLPLFIADGHHRYESALRYRNAQRESQPSADRLPSDLVLMYFSNLDNAGLTILPTHRLIHGPLPCPVEEFRKRMTENFTVKEFPFTRATEAAVRERFLRALRAARSSKEHVLGMAVHGESQYDLYALNAKGDSKLGASARDRLDVSLLQQLVLRDAMRMTAHDEERLTYMKDEEAVFRAVAAGDCEMAILLNPPKITEVKDVASAGDRMPHKSTYFYPKPLTGLVINKMD